MSACDTACDIQMPYCQKFSVAKSFTVFAIFLENCDILFSWNLDGVSNTQIWFSDIYFIKFAETHPMLPIWLPIDQWE